MVPQNPLYFNRANITIKHNNYRFLIFTYQINFIGYAINGIYNVIRSKAPKHTGGQHNEQPQHGKQGQGTLGAEAHEGRTGSGDRHDGR